MRYVVMPKNFCLKIVHILFAVIIWVLLLSPISAAESLFIKDGSIIEGKVLSETDDVIIIKLTNGTQRKIKRLNIIRTLYHNNYKQQVYITMNGGNVVQAYIVDENSESYTYRLDLNSTDEVIVSKTDIESISKRNQGDNEVDIVPPDYLEEEYFQVRKDR